jgi:invasion protein IalB
MTRSLPVLALTALLAASPALAQQRPATPTPPPPPPAPAPAPAPAAPVAEEQRPWVVACTGNGAAKECQITATVTLRTNERLARVIIRRQPETRSLTMVFQLPHGAWLPGGVQWQVDEGEAQRLGFQTSDAEGLYAGIPVTDDVLGLMRRGASLRLAAVAAQQRQVVQIPVPLVRFGDSFADFLRQEQAR